MQRQSEIGGVVNTCMTSIEWIKNTFLLSQKQSIEWLNEIEKEEAIEWKNEKRHCIDERKTFLPVLAVHWN